MKDEQGNECMFTLECKYLNLVCLETVKLIEGHV